MKAQALSNSEIEKIEMMLRKRCHGDSWQRFFGITVNLLKVIEFYLQHVLVVLAVKYPAYRAM